MFKDYVKEDMGRPNGKPAEIRIVNSPELEPIKYEKVLTLKNGKVYADKD